MEAEQLREVDHIPLALDSYLAKFSKYKVVIERNLHDNNKRPGAAWTTVEPFISIVYFLFSYFWESSIPSRL